MGLSEDRKDIEYTTDRDGDKPQVFGQRSRVQVEVPPSWQVYDVDKEDIHP